MEAKRFLIVSSFDDERCPWASFPQLVVQPSIDLSQRSMVELLHCLILLSILSIFFPSILSLKLIPQIVVLS